MRTYEEALLKRMGLLRSRYMRTMRGAHMSVQQHASPNYTAATKQEPQAPSYANKYYSALKTQAAGVSKPLQTFQSLISTGVTPTARPSSAVNNVSTTFLLSKEIPVYKRRTPVIARNAAAKLIVPKRYGGRFSFAEDMALQSGRNADAAIKKQQLLALLQLRKRQQERAALKLRRTRLAMVGIGAGLLLSNAFRPQQPAQQPQQPVRRQAPVQQPTVMAQQQRTVPQYTVLRAQVVSPHQAARSNGIVQLRSDTNRYRALRAEKQQQKQYPLHTMQNRSHIPSKYNFSTRLINT